MGKGDVSHMHIAQQYSLKGIAGANSVSQIASGYVVSASFLLNEGVVRAAIQAEHNRNPGHAFATNDARFGLALRALRNGNKRNEAALMK